jgi:hypothetical protein
MEKSGSAGFRASSASKVKVFRQEREKRRRNPRRAIPENGFAVNTAKNAPCPPPARINA